MPWRPASGRSRFSRMPRLRRGPRGSRVHGAMITRTTRGRRMSRRRFGRPESSINRLIRSGRLSCGAWASLLPGRQGRCFAFAAWLCRTGSRRHDRLSLRAHRGGRRCNAIKSRKTRRYPGQPRGSRGRRSRGGRCRRQRRRHCRRLDRAFS